MAQPGRWSKRRRRRGGGAGRTQGRLGPRSRHGGVAGAGHGTLQAVGQARSALHQVTEIIGEALGPVDFVLAGSGSDFQPGDAVLGPGRRLGEAGGLPAEFALVGANGGKPAIELEGENDGGREQNDEQAVDNETEDHDATLPLSFRSMLSEMRTAIRLPRRPMLAR